MAGESTYHAVEQIGVGVILLDIDEVPMSSYFEIV
jgi:hypothetical protein